MHTRVHCLPLMCAPISAAMESAQVVALTILGSYFGVIAGLFTVIVRSIPATRERQQQRNAFKLLTVLSRSRTPGTVRLTTPRNRTSRLMLETDMFSFMRVG
jgi:hypothetical protein